MGHLVGKEIYQKLGKKVDGLTTKAPWNKILFAILCELYSPEEAKFVVKMPYGLSDFNRLINITHYHKSAAIKILTGLCSKGLVIDLWLDGKYYYAPSPLIIGIFEFTMMRTRGELKTREWAELFHEYLLGDDSFFAANFKAGEKIAVMRSLPHQEAIPPSEYLEVLDYEKAAALVEQSDKFAIGLCSCRHEKLHAGEKNCDVPLNNCSSFGLAADYLIRNNLAKEVSGTEMMENILRSKELGLVLNADNVQKNVTFICHCCKCCCNALAGISKFGYANSIVTSSFIAEIDHGMCTGCGKCMTACPIDAIEMLPPKDPTPKKKLYPRIESSLCLGCGVCGLKCAAGALKLVKRGARVIHPETTFEKVILGCLERGTLQNQLFDNPRSITQKFLRAFVGAFLRLPGVKKVLMSHILRSSFLQSMKMGAKMAGKEWVTKL